LLALAQNSEAVVRALTQLQLEQSRLQREREALEAERATFATAKEANDLAIKAQKIIDHHKETVRLLAERVAEHKTL
jgi:hypothetical protein